MSTPQPIAVKLAEHLATIHIGNISANAKRVAIAGIIDTIGVTLLGATEPVISVLQNSLLGDVTTGKALVQVVLGWNIASLSGSFQFSVTLRANVGLRL